MRFLTSLFVILMLLNACHRDQPKVSSTSNEYTYLDSCRFTLNSQKCKFDLSICNLISIKRYEVSDPKYYRYDILYLENKDTMNIRVYPETLERDWNRLFLNDSMTMGYDRMIEHQWGIYYDEDIGANYQVDTIRNVERGTKGLMITKGDQALAVIKSEWDIAFLVFPNYLASESQKSIITNFYQWR